MEIILPTTTFSTSVDIFSILSKIMPFTINALGIKEGLTIYLFGLAGVNKELSLSVSLVGRFLTILLSLPGGILFLINSMSFRKKEIR